MNIPTQTIVIMVGVHAPDFDTDDIYYRLSDVLDFPDCDDLRHMVCDGVIEYNGYTVCDIEDPKDTSYSYFGLVYEEVHDITHFTTSVNIAQILDMRRSMDNLGIGVAEMHVLVYYC